jgi:hypothetical protein
MNAYVYVREYDGEQDGVYPYCWSADGAVFKNVDGLNVTITESGDYLVSGNCGKVLGLVGPVSR